MVIKFFFTFRSWLKLTADYKLITPKRPSHFVLDMDEIWYKVGYGMHT
jgi:hypothetical protein